MPESMLFKRLQTVADLNAEDRAELHHLCRNVGTVHAKKDISSEGDRPQRVHLIVKGWAASYALLPNGARQITGFLIPGDFGDLHVTVLGHMDHGIVALTSCKVSYIDGDELDHVALRNSRLTCAMLWSTLVDEAVLRQWVVNVGRRDAHSRIAHILCELHARMSMVGLVDADRLALPLTQTDLADATGLTAVHINRTLQRLRKEGLIEVGSGMLKIMDVGALKEAGGFDDAYLHIKRRSH
jgi:CRP-like cAMP-binding protein